HSSIIVAGATAVPQRFYRRFAEFTARQGYETVTLDYRGIGRSAPPNLRDFRVDYADWARRDLAAAVDTLAAEGRPVYVVGHSYGGACYGLIPNHDKVAGLYAFGAGAGWHGWMPRLEQLRVLTMWHGVAPALSAAMGYLPWSFVMSGEDLPLDVYKQWKRWCSFPHFLLDDPQMEGVRDTYAAVRTPMVVANSIDDPWSPPKSRDAIMTGYVCAPWMPVDIDPAARGIPRPIGHMGYFRESSRPLWDDVVEYFDEVRAG
ncbi:MAG: alpha/beta fold hydrolase, partial [Microbacteriaceae bacterium]|nr:alpha/beta fold hydrolase [Microbacteriaceae bacterium]HOB57128.1 alpha/beta fold hydrolase [Rhodoglobus sp.]